MNKPVTFAICGFGNIGTRHAQHITEQEGAILTAVCDTDKSRAGSIPAGVRFYSSFESLLDAGVPEVVSICTPNHLHAAQAIQAMNAGAHALVEKPMALSTTECDAMMHAAQEAKRIIFAVKQNRYNEPVAEVKKLIERNRLGKVFFIQVNCFWNRGDAYYSQSAWRGKLQQDGGILFTQFSHFVDILYYLNGPLQLPAYGFMNNYAHSHNTEFEDTGVMSLKAANGALISFNFTTAAYARNMEGAITIFAEKGTVKIGGQYLNTIEYQQIEGTPLPPVNISAKANDYGLYQGSMSNHDRVIENVVDVLRHGKPVMTGAAEGKAVVQMIEQMYASVSK